MDAPHETEIHTIQPIGKNHVVYVQSGKPQKVVIMEIPSLKVVREFEIEGKKIVHGQCRNARLTSKGTLLVAHMDMNFVREYDSKGAILRTIDLPGVWGITELANGNLLASCRKYVREVGSQGETVWEADFTNKQYKSMQTAVRMKNGNTIINTWFSEWDKIPLDRTNPPVQAIGISPDKKVVWELCSWVKPDLGPSTIIQPLEKKVDRTKMFFGEFK